MSVDRSKLIFYSADDAFKNATVSSGSISLPTSLTAGQTATITTTVSLPDSPLFVDFFANFLEEQEAISLYITGAGTTPKRWYSENVSGNFGIGLHVNSPSSNVGWISAGLYPEINGSTATVTAVAFNPYSNTITLDPVTVDFAFVEYMFAN